MAVEVHYFVQDGQQKSGEDALHFDRLYLAIRAYKTLPMTCRKVLGVETEDRSAELARCVPLRPGDGEGEDVIALDFLRDGFGDARPALIKAAQDLADCLRVRYCLCRGCILQVPTKRTLPKSLRGRYLWPAEPGKFETAIQWIKVVGVGSVSPAEFKRRFPSEESAAQSYPLVLRLNVHSRTEKGSFCSLDVTPWEFMLLEGITRARQTLKGVVQVDEKELLAKLEEKVSACWSAYVEKLLTLSPKDLINMVEEIAAANYCYGQLTVSADLYPADLLEHLLRFDDPLEAMRDQWMDEQNVDYSDDFEHALWTLREYGPEPEEPTTGGMTME